MTVIHAHETPGPALGRVIADLAALASDLGVDYALEIAALDGRAGPDVPVHVVLPGVGG